MKKRVVFPIALFILLTTINPLQKIKISDFSLKEIEIKNNFILKDEEIKKLLLPIYNKNLITLNYSEVEDAIMQNNFIESFNVKKKYPNVLRIKVFEKKPIAVLFYEKKKFYLSENIDLIKFKNLENYQNLPHIFGDKERFEQLYLNLKKINFPLNIIEKYRFFESNRWDLETKNKKIIKLPNTNYIRSLKNYLKIRNKDSFEKFTIFDYRINEQLILK